MKSIEELIFEKRFDGEDFNPNDFNDWAKENEFEAYKLCLEISNELRTQLTNEIERWRQKYSAIASGYETKILSLYKSMKQEYRGYTIKPDFRNPYSNDPDFMFYKTDEGIQHDADLDGEDYRYCGNCKWSPTLEDAKDEIDELIL